MTDNNQPSTLTVYKASAGSGKTFRLTVEYIKLLLQAPNCYKNILAVTFTNKATDEMKTRILSTLYGLCNGLESSASYLQKLTEETGRTQESVRELAGQALHNLLHDYQHFQVQTIDKFFQHIFRKLFSTGHVHCLHRPVIIGIGEQQDFKIVGIDIAINASLGKRDRAVGLDVDAEDSSH